MLKRVVPGVYETVILLVVLVAQKCGLFGLQEETKSHRRVIEVLR
jgi:hypothetical protein